MDVDELSATLSALADPTRRAILARLADGEAMVGELAAPFDMSAPAISKHLKVLERANLIARRKDAQRRVCRLQPGALEAASAWISRYRRFWEGQFDALENYLNRMDSEEEEKDDRDRSRRDR